MGWNPSNYAGFPLFYHYFPLSFLLMVALSLLAPLKVAFKLVTFLSVILLPPSVYLMFYFLGYGRVVSCIGSLVSVAFLFNEKNSMWGGNIPSMLAGEFSFSLSLVFFTVLFGSIYKGIKEKRHLVLNAFLVALTGLSHGYTLVTMGISNIFYLFSENWKSNLYYLFRVYFFGSFLMAFWFLPFIANLPWTTPFSFKWAFSSIWEIFPPILIPFFALSVVGMVTSLKDERTKIFVFTIAMSIAGYLVAPYLGLGDIRFLSFTQYFLTLFSSTFLAGLWRIYTEKSPGSQFLGYAGVSLCVALSIFIWVKYNSHYIREWVKWNYTGFEGKQNWQDIEPLFYFLRGSKFLGDTGRVVYEHSSTYNKYGTVRIFESLRYFADRDTLEGLYMQSSVTAPFVFYVQAEISQEISAPFRQYPVGTFNLDLAVKHLSLFNVSQLIAISDQTKAELKKRKEFLLEKRFGEIDVYRFFNPEPGYVVPARFEPVAYAGKNWKRDFYEWFKNPENLDVPLVYVPETRKETNFKFTSYTPDNLPKIPIQIPSVEIIEKIDYESIEFTTNLLRYPHIIRVSYHPNWKVEGARDIYLVSPSFMLVFPDRHRVKLTFRKSVYNYAGEFLSLVCLMFFFLISLSRKKVAKSL